MHTYIVSQTHSALGALLLSKNTYIRTYMHFDIIQIQGAFGGLFCGATAAATGSVAGLRR
jgi:hypothetical protein